MIKKKKHTKTRLRLSRAMPLLSASVSGYPIYDMIVPIPFQDAEGVTDPGSQDTIYTVGRYSCSYYHSINSPVHPFPAVVDFNHRIVTVILTQKNKTKKN